MKKLTCLILVLLLCLPMYSAFAKVTVNESGYPIVDEPITLRVITTLGSFYGESNNMTYWNELEKLTGINLEIEHISQNAQERYTLMYASLDFPDIAMNGSNDVQVLEAVEGGYVYPLNEMMEKWAPTWHNFFQKNDFAKRLATMPDGNIYSLMMVRDEDSNCGIRDQWMINVQWMNELGLSMPTNTDEFYEYLKALKDNAGTGTIPKEVIPWCIIWKNWANGGVWELYNAFGVFSGDANFIYVNDDKQVQFQATNPAIKEPLKYLNKLYTEGLILPEMFTDGGTEFDAKTLSKPPVTGTYLRYFNDDLTEQIYDVLPPMTSPVNDKPMYRAQNNAFMRNIFVVFKNCEYPEAALRLADTIAQPEWSLQAMYGMIGDWITDNGDGTYDQKPAVGNEAYQNVPGNSVPFILNMDLLKNFKYTGSQGQRDKNVKEVYKPYTVDIERMFPGLVWNTDDLARVTEIRVDLIDYVNSTFADWIINGNIDQGWDAYVAQVENMNLKEMLELYQKQLDSFYK